MNLDRHLVRRVFATFELVKSCDGSEHALRTVSGVDGSRRVLPVLHQRRELVDVLHHRITVL